MAKQFSRKQRDRCRVCKLDDTLPLGGFVHVVGFGSRIRADMDRRRHPS